MIGLKNYLKQEGLVATVKRAWIKAFHHNDSYTVFLRLELGDERIEERIEGIEFLDEHNRNAFESIKFWDFVKTEDFIKNDYQSVIMLKAGDEYIAYAAEEHGTNRVIHGLGSFKLKSNEGWIGPVYVRREWRGNGYNRQLLMAQAKYLQERGVTKIYTAINSRNESSMKSFRSVGFRKIGTVNNCGSIMMDTGNVLHVAYKNMEGA